MRMITLSNNKGGSGKTTTTVSLASALAERSLRVLVVDLDPQGSATKWLGGHESSIGLVEFSEGGIRVAELVQTSTARGVDLVPSSPSLIPSGEASENQTGLAIVRALRRVCAEPARHVHGKVPRRDVHRGGTCGDGVAGRGHFLGVLVAADAGEALAGLGAEPAAHDLHGAPLRVERLHGERRVGRHLEKR